MVDELDTMVHFFVDGGLELLVQTESCPNDHLGYRLVTEVLVALGGVV
jgi:hypothetical protein